MQLESAASQEEHELHSDEPSLENVSGSHVVHVALPAFEYFPAGHDKQGPPRSEYFPAGQSEHSESHKVADWPAGQALHVVALTDAGIEPTGQGEHS